MTLALILASTVVIIAVLAAVAIGAHYEILPTRWSKPGVIIALVVYSAAVVTLFTIAATHLFTIAAT